MKQATLDRQGIRELPHRLQRGATRAHGVPGNENPYLGVCLLGVLYFLGCPVEARAGGVGSFPGSGRGVPHARGPGQGTRTRAYWREVKEG